MFHGDFGFVQLTGLLELGIAMKGLTKQILCSCGLVFFSSSGSQKLGRICI
jgi:hypothetical protein